MARIQSGLKKSFKKKTRKKLAVRKKYCRFCVDKSTIDYKNSEVLRKFTTERGKIIPRRVSGNCALHQRRLTNAIKRARYIALLPYLGT